MAKTNEIHKIIKRNIRGDILEAKTLKDKEEKQHWVVVEVRL